MALAITNSKGVTYYLHSKETTLKNGQPSTLYFFAKTVRENEAVDQLPAGRVVSESKNGLPVLKKAV